MGDVAVDMTGQRFARLLVVGRAGTVRRKATWRCVCDCGREVVVIGQNLRRGITRSCSCLSHDISRTQLTTHGCQGTPEHRAWQAMVSRCHYLKDASYWRYGAKGIRVSDEWRADFTVFLAHIGPMPAAGLSVDRIDNTRGYEPGNVRWATREEQGRNRSVNRRVEYAGRTLCLVEWAEVTGLRYVTIQSRLDRGWTPERALTEPPRRRAITL